MLPRQGLGQVVDSGLRDNPVARGSESTTNVKITPAAHDASHTGQINLAESSNCESGNMIHCPTMEGIANHLVGNGRYT